MFRGKFLAGLRALHQHGKLVLSGGAAGRIDLGAFRQLLRALYRRDWVVYAKPAFGGAEQVFRYLGRYTHRVAISNSRLVHLDANQVRFRYKDYADGNRIKEMTLAADEFLRRFLLHVLPRGFVRIRHYGLLASRNVSTKLERAGELLGSGQAAPQPPPAPKAAELSDLDISDLSGLVCPRCQARLTRQYIDGRHELAFLNPPPRRVAICDSS